MDPVIVAGAGPVGLALALALARHEVPVILLDGDGTGPRPAHPEQTVVLRPQTADLLVRLGYPGVYADSARWTGWRTLRRRQELEHVRFATAEAESADRPRPALPGPSGARRGTTPATTARTTGGAARHGADGGPAALAAPTLPAPLHLAQDRLCAGLRSAVAEQRLVTVVTAGRLDGIEQDEHGVSVRIRDAESVGTWSRGTHLVGCDGPRSTVRKLLGVRFPGRTAVARYAVTAVRVALPDPGTALLHRDPPGVRGAEVTARPLPDGLWRVDWPLRSGGPPLTADALVGRLRDALGAWCAGSVPPYDLLGSAEYPVHQRLARRWRVGRVFLAGDAAHLMGALGTQGLEEGLRDADNLAWKVALAWHQGASDTLLDSYESERRGAVGARLRTADHTLPLVRDHGAVRRSLLPGGSQRHAHLLADGHIGRGPLGAPPVYDRSPLTPPAPRRAARSALAPGTAVLDVPVTGMDGLRHRLRDRLGRHLLALLVAPGTGVWDSRHWLTAGLMPELSAAVAALPTRTELLVTDSYPGATAHTVLLIRPDGHLLGTSVGCRPEQLRLFTDTARGGPPRDTTPAVGPRTDVDNVIPGTRNA